MTGPSWPVAGGYRYRDGVRAGAPVGVAAFAFGVSFGVLARSAGLGRLAPVLMSATTFAGSAQFAAASILGAGGGVAAAVAAAVLLNLRYGPIGLSAAPGLDGPLWLRVVTAQLVVDESWAISQRDAGRVDRHLLVGAGFVLYAGWVAGTAAGGLAGGLAVDPARLGLDAAFPALFLALLVPQLRSPRRGGEGEAAGGAAGSRRDGQGEGTGGTVGSRPDGQGEGTGGTVGSRRVAAAGGALIAIVLVPLTGPGIPIVVASLACLVGVVRR